MRHTNYIWRIDCPVIVAICLTILMSVSATAQRRLSGSGVYEAEDLVGAGKAIVSAGSVTAQPMAGFGQGWSGNAQLFWGGGQPGAVLDLILDIPAEGIYEVELHMTRAPDFARLRIQVDGKYAAERFDGYARSVVTTGAIPVGTFDLQPGPRTIRFVIDGKNASSSNYFAGIDFVRLKRIPVAASQTSQTQSGLEPTPKWSITAMSIQPEPTEQGSGGMKAYKPGDVITIKCSYEPIVPGEARLRIVEVTGYEVGQDWSSSESWIKHDAVVTKAGSKTTSFAVGTSPAGLVHRVYCGVASFNTTKWTFPFDVNWEYLDYGYFDFQVVAGPVPTETKWATAPIIQMPINNGKILVTPRNAASSHCAEGGIISFEWRYLDKGFKTYEPSTWKPLKMMVKPLACVPGGSIKDVSGLKPGQYQVRAKEFNGKYNFESEWSDWVEFEIPPK